MSGLDVVLEGLTGYSYRQLLEMDSETSWTGKLAVVVSRFGVRGATKVIDVDRRTIQRWRTAIGHRQAPKAASLAKLDTAFRLALLRDPVPTVGSLTVRTRDRDSGRVRVLTNDNLRFAPDTVTRMIARYAEGDFAGVVPAFLSGIGDLWYRSWLSGSWRAEPEHKGQPISGLTRDPRSGVRYEPSDFGVGDIEHEHDTGGGGGGDYGAEMVAMS